MEEQRIVELLTRKIAGEATPAELGELSYLLSKYPDAVYYEALLEQVWDLGESANEQSDEVFERHKNRFKDELVFDKPAGMRRRIWAYTAIAASVLLVGIAAFFFTRTENHPELVEITAGRGVRKEIMLPDGSTVRLNSDSKLTYSPAMLDMDAREVRLTGEAFFDVKHDKGHPFIVSTGKVKVRVLGTEFNVREYPGEGESETTLLRGAVELSINDRAEQKFLLKPSEKFALVDKGQTPGAGDKNSAMIIENVSPVKVGDKEYIREVTWIENKLVFQNETFEELLPKLERWYNVEINISESAIRNYRFTGVFVNENVIQALEAMQIIKPFNYKINENEIKIY